MYPVGDEQVCWQKWPCRPWFNQWWHQRRGLPLPTGPSPKMGKSLLSIFRPNQGSPTTEKFCPPSPPPNSLPQHYYLSAVSLRKLRRKPGFPSHTCTCTSDFVTKSYGGSWDSSCEKLWVPVLNQWENELKIENAWAFMKPDSHRLQNSVLQYTKIKM